MPTEVMHSVFWSRLLVAALFANQNLLSVTLELLSSQWESNDIGSHPLRSTSPTKSPSIRPGKYK